MMREYAILQAPGEPARTWFTDNTLELIVWRDPAGAVSGFQLAWIDRAKEFALTWWTPNRFTFDRVDSGESQSVATQTPILIPEMDFPLGAVTEQFAARSADLPTPLRDLVTRTLADAAPALALWRQVRPRRPRSFGGRLIARGAGFPA